MSPEPPPQPEPTPPPDPEPGPAPVALCPHCGAENRPEDERCARCRQPLELRIGPEATPPPPRRRGRFTLGSLMLLILLIAVFLGLLREAPGLGVAVAFLVTPALARTVVAYRRRSERGEPMKVTEQMLAFVGSIGLMITVGFASLATFILTCTPVGLVALQANAEVGVYAAFGVGGLAGIAVAFLLFRRFWSRGFNMPEPIEIRYPEDRP